LSLDKNFDVVAKASALPLVAPLTAEPTILRAPVAALCPIHNGIPLAPLRDLPKPEIAPILVRAPTLERGLARIPGAKPTK